MILTKFFLISVVDQHLNQLTKYTDAIDFTLETIIRLNRISNYRQTAV